MAIALRADFDAARVRAAAKRSKDGPQARRLLALAAIYDGASRAEAARIGGVTVQIIRDWVLRFNAQGPEGLVDRKAPGQPSRLNEAHRAALAAMNLHLAEIATQIAPDAHAAILVDQAGWHLSGKLRIPSNITLIPLPAKCPELNPQENIWQFMRDNWLSNRLFKSYDDIVNHCCGAWNKLIDQPWKIMSIATRNWAYRS